MALVLPEEVAARLLADAVYRRTSLRVVAGEFFSRRPGLDYLKPVVRVLTLGVARNWMLLDRALGLLGYGPPSHSVRWMLARVLAFEAMFGRLKRGRVERLAPRCGLSVEDVFRLRDLRPGDVVRGLPGLERLAVRYSFPRWVLEELLSAGLEPLAPLLEALNRDPVRWVRVRPGVDRGALARSLAEQGVVVEWDEVLPDAGAVVEGADRVTRTREWREGVITLQDRASILVGHVASPSGRVAGDVTCGAAVKASHLAWLGARFVVAGDVKASRLVEARGVVSRLRVGHLVDLFVGDARSPPLRGLDVTIVDPPCTDVGRLQYEPEVKMWITRGDLHVYARLQHRILSSILRYAPSGSEVVYSVCTLTWSETVRVVRRVQRDLGDLVELVDAEPFVGERVPGVPWAQRLLPHKHRCQGFFIAKFRRR